MEWRGQLYTLQNGVAFQGHPVGCQCTAYASYYLVMQQSRNQHIQLICGVCAYDIDVDEVGASV
eukprot:651539-Prorocentrum_minimum.AAC.2